MWDQESCRKRRRAISTVPAAAPLAANARPISQGAELSSAASAPAGPTVGTPWGPGGSHTSPLPSTLSSGGRPFPSSSRVVDTISFTLKTRVCWFWRNWQLKWAARMAPRPVWPGGRDGALPSERHLKMTGGGIATPTRSGPGGGLPSRVNTAPRRNVGLHDLESNVALTRMGTAQDATRCTGLHHRDLPGGQGVAIKSRQPDRNIPLPQAHCPFTARPISAAHSLL